MTKPLSSLQVVAVRYQGVRPADDDERALDAYERAEVYAAAQVPVDLFEPRFLGTPRSSDQPQAYSDL